MERLDFMSKIQAIFISIFGAVGALLVQLFGGWTTDLQTLIIFMAVDFAMGLIIAGVFNKSTKTETGSLNSSVGFKGLCKKGVALLFVLVANRLDKTMNVDYIRNAVIIAFIVNETISIFENAGTMGIPIPKIMKKAIEVLKDKTESEGK